DVCAWQGRAAVVAAIRGLLNAGGAEKLADPGILFRTLALPLKPPELKTLGEAVARRVHARTPSSAPYAQSNAAATRERIRVGFLSP
ncbi:hypothetical protein OVW19_29325, partial [Klebsiella pneumoniae]|uniref:hypothetical protein n=1 Tax=Klebsiella pneumoniae TaxID=573 RepID=UPI002270074C